MSRLRVAGVGLLLVGVLGACSSDSKSSSTTSGTPAVAESGGASAAATTQPASPNTDAGSNGTPKDACSIVTTDDVAAAFGGTVAPGVANPDNGGCDYEISGTTNTGAVGVFAQISIAYGQSDYTAAAEEKVVFPDVVEVKGVGEAAWYMAFGHQLHASLNGTELQISGILPGDDAAIQAEIVAFAAVVADKL